MRRTWRDVVCAGESQVARVGPFRGSRQVRPTPCPVGHPPTWAASPYDGAVRAALVAFKDEDRRDLQTLLASMLSEAVGAALDKGARVVGQSWRTPNGPQIQR